MDSSLKGIFILKTVEAIHILECLAKFEQNLSVGICFIMSSDSFFHYREILDFEYAECNCVIIT